MGLSVLKDAQWRAYRSRREARVRAILRHAL